MRAMLIAVAVAFCAVGAHAQTVKSISHTTWRVDTSWSNHAFFWVFEDNGRYRDTDGPTGSWTQDGAAVTLKADAGFTYRVTLSGDSASGTVYNDSDNSTAGTFRAQRVTAAPEKQ
jgi:hypothetical protein